MLAGDILMNWPGETTRYGDLRGGRLVARVNYRTAKVFILHILTHREYDKGVWK